MTASPSESLVILFDKAIELIDGLNRLSDQELAAIEAQSAEQLSATVDSKNQILNEFGENISLRNQIIIGLGQEPTESGFLSLLKQLPPAQSRSLQERAQMLQQLLEKAAQLNTRNEQIVSRNQKNLKQLIRILQGQQRNSQLYRQNGVVGNYAAQSIIGKA